MSRIDEFRTLVGQSIGEASVCWDTLPTGTFDSSHASALINKIVAAYDYLLKENEDLRMQLATVEIMNTHAPLFGKLRESELEAERDQYKLLFDIVQAELIALKGWQGLPEFSVNAAVEEASKDYVRATERGYCLVDAFVFGAEWQYEQDLANFPKLKEIKK